MSARPQHSEYQVLLQSVDDDPEAAEEGRVSTSSEPEAGPSAPRGRRTGGGASIDLNKLDNAFKRWTESIAQKVKRKKSKAPGHSHRPRIWRSVFEPTIPPGPSYGPVKTLDHKPPMTDANFDAVVQSVKSAIAEGVHPKMITKGSSGSYFARAKTNGRVQTVAVFKPKDEEPYGRLNPKTTKWLHRQFRWIIPFGRACLIPNLSYISEAAASLLDTRLDLHIVPPTKLVSFSSKAFFYDWLDRNAAKKGKPLPEKIGSMQHFMHGYQDASEFLRKHPWPGRAISDTFDDSTHRQGSFSKRFMGALKIICGRTGGPEDVYDEVDFEEDHALYDATEGSEAQRPFYWSQGLQLSFREELEKLVILDYLMLNTDRGADNYMIKYCEGDHEKLVDVAPTRSVRLEMPLMSELRRPESSSSSPQMNPSSSYNRPTTSSPPTRPATPHHDYKRRPHIHIAAIDNSLSFPHEHPQGWRSYTYGWLYLPVSIIGRPFSERTRNHFLPLLTSKAWWEETTYQLEKLFAVDPDFHPRMFARQLAVIKGQAWNIVQSLKHDDEGPLELTRRIKVLVWDEEVEVTELENTRNGDNRPASPTISINSVPLPRRSRSQSYGEFPPPMRRTSTDASGAPRPVPFAAKFQRVHPGTTGVTVLEHLERLDAVEASLQRLGVDEEEVDMGVSSAPLPSRPSHSRATSNAGPSPFSPPGSPLATVPEGSGSTSRRSSIDSLDEEDLATMSKSTSHVEGGHPFGRNIGTISSAGLDWISPEDEPEKRFMIAERLETAKAKPLCSCW